MQYNGRGTHLFLGNVEVDTRCFWSADAHLGEAQLVVHDVLQDILHLPVAQFVFEMQKKRN